VIEFLFAGVLALAVPIAALLGAVAFFSIRTLRGRVAVLEAQLAALRARPFLAPEAASPLVPSAPRAGEATRAEPPSSPEPLQPPETLAALPTPPPAHRTPRLRPEATTTAPPGTDIESALGTRWAVWVGAAALGVGGLLLVVTAVEQGWVGPAGRVALAGLLGLALLAAGEALVRLGYDRPDGAPRWADTPSLVTAAGVSTLFGAVWAAHAIVPLIGPITAFVGLVTVALLAILQSFRHAPWLSGLGLLGGYAVPLLTASKAPSEPWVLVGLLLVLAATGFALARLRRWRPLALLVIVCHGLWCLPLVLAGGPLGSSPLAAVLAGHAALAAVYGGLAFAAAAIPSAGPFERGIAFASAVLAAVLAAAFLLVAGGSASAALVGTVVIVTLAVAALSPRLRWHATIAGALAVAVVGAYKAIELSTMLDLARSPVVTSHAFDETTRIALGYAALLGGAGFLAVLRTGDARLALAAAGTPIALLGVTYLRFRHLDVAGLFGVTACLLAVLLAAMSELLARRLPADPTSFSTTGVAAAGSAAALGLGLGFLVPAGGLPLGFAAAALAVAAVWTVRPLPLLRYATLGAAMLSLLVIARHPAELLPSSAAWPVLNALAIGLALPSLAIGLSAHVLRRGSLHPVVVALEAIACLLGVVWLWTATGHAITGRVDLVPELPDAAALGARALALAVAGAALGQLSERTDSVIYRTLAQVAHPVAALVSVVALTAHPLLTGGPVRGGGLVNGLLIAYLLPGLALIVSARRRPPSERPGVAAGVEVVGHLLVLAWITGTILVAFRGPLDARPPMGESELWAYSAAGLVCGVALLALGLAFARPSLRVASAAVLVGTSLKVFFVDLSDLTGLWRAFSFIGLGLVLVAIGLAYQRVLLRRGGRDVATPPQ
jgi:uncharacterized membrane protein